ncbi:MAG: DUF2064 domain-containing protein [Myxococcota bacterium]
MGEGADSWPRPETEVSLGVFARAPKAGSTKTRLGAAIGHEAAAALHRAFIEDTLVHCQTLAPTTLFVTEDHPFFDEVAARAKVAIARQRGDGLGARMRAALQDLRQKSAAGVLVGSDAPWWPPRALRDAVAAHLAFGPSHDGGFYLVSAKGDVDFDGITWSTASTLSQTLAANAARAPLLLEPWFDVDEIDDLQTLMAFLGAAPADCAIHTRAALALAGLSNGT